MALNFFALNDDNGYVTQVYQSAVTGKPQGTYTHPDITINTGTVYPLDSTGQTYPLGGPQGTALGDNVKIISWKFVHAGGAQPFHIRCTREYGKYDHFWLNIRLHPNESVYVATPNTPLHIGNQSGTNSIYNVFSYSNGYSDSDGNSARYNTFVTYAWAY